MGGFDSLRGVLDAEQLRNLEEDFARFRERTGSDDRDLFVQYLAQQGLLSHDQLIAALRVRGRPETSELDALLARFSDSGHGAQRTFAAMSPEGTYALLATVGEGSMGRVHVGKDHDLKRKVAFKEISEALSADRGLVRRFLHEVQITAQLDHPAVVPVYGLEVSREGRIGYAMKLVEGRTLQEVVEAARDSARKGRTLDAADGISARLEHFIKVCEAIGYAHSRGVIHRDLKPDNIMVGRFGEVYVMDWGLARLLADPTDGDSSILGGRTRSGTQMGHAVGTPAYMAPEQAQGRNAELGPTSDGYALGLILQELVTLEPAIDGKTGREVLERAARGERNPLSHVAGIRIPGELAAIIAKATAHHPKDRYPEVLELAEDVRRYLRGRAPKAYDEGIVGRASRWLVRYREAVLVILLVLAVGVGSAIVGSLVLVQAQAWASQKREEHLASVLTQVSTQAHLIDAELQRYERLLEAAASASVTVLSETEPEEGEPVFHAADFDDPDRAPPDLVTAPRYGMPVSFGYPAFKLAPGVDPEAVDEDVRRLLRLRHPFKRLMLRTGIDGSLALKGDQVREVLGEQGVPVAWMFVGTARGVHVGYPGHGGYPEGFDPRKRPWYTLSADERGINWGNPYVDVNGLGLTLPASTALYDAAGRFLGVAGIDLTFDYIIDTMLASPLPGAPESFLLDEEGRIVVRSGDAGKSVSAGIHDNETLRLETFDVPVVVDLVKERRSGYVLDGDELVVFYRLHAIGWYYAIRGNEAALLSR